MVLYFLEAYGKTYSHAQHSFGGRKGPFEQSHPAVYLSDVDIFF